MQAFQLPDGQIIDLFMEGEGPALVLVHGWTSGPHIWQPFLEQLKTRYKVIAWHARGHGSYATDIQSCTVSQLAQDLNYVLESNFIDSPILVGHSMGAMTCWEYIRQFGDSHLRGLVTIDQTPMPKNDKDWGLGIYGSFDSKANRVHIENMQNDFAEACLQLAANGLNKNITWAYSNNNQFIKDLRVYLSGLNSEAMIAFWSDFIERDWRDVVGGLKVPTSVIHGTDSQFYLPEVLEFYKDNVECLNVSTIDQASHSPQVSHPDMFFTSLADGLSFITEKT